MKMPQYETHGAYHNTCVTKALTSQVPASISEAMKTSNKDLYSQVVSHLF